MAKRRPSYLPYDIDPRTIGKGKAAIVLASMINDGNIPKKLIRKSLHVINNSNQLLNELVTSSARIRAFVIARIASESINQIDSWLYEIPNDDIRSRNFLSHLKTVIITSCRSASESYV